MQSNVLFITSESEKPEPWSSRWVLRRIQEKGRLTALKDLKTFTHKTRREEISPEVLKAIKEATPEQALFYLNNLHHQQRYIVGGGRKQLDVKGTLTRKDTGE